MRILFIVIVVFAIYSCTDSGNNPDKSKDWYVIYEDNIRSFSAVFNDTTNTFEYTIVFDSSSSLNIDCYVSKNGIRQKTLSIGHAVYIGKGSELIYNYTPSGDMGEIDFYLKNLIMGMIDSSTIGPVDTTTWIESHNKFEK